MTRFLPDGLLDLNINNQRNQTTQARPDCDAAQAHSRAVNGRRVPSPRRKARVRPLHAQTRPEVLAEHFELPEVPWVEPRYNIAPTQPMAVVRLDQASGDAGSPCSDGA